MPPMSRLPALLLMYVVGIATLQKTNGFFLNSIFFNPQNRDHSRDTFITRVANIHKAFFINPQHPLTLNEAFYRNLRVVFERLIRSDAVYRTTFDQYETFLALAYIHDHKTGDTKLHWMPVHIAEFSAMSHDYLRTYFARLEADPNLLSCSSFGSNRDLYGILSKYDQIQSQAVTEDTDRVASYAASFGKGKYLFEV